VILRVRINDPDLQRKGRVLAVVLLMMLAGIVVLATFNLAQGYTQYNVSNATFFLLVAGVFWVNRAGYVTAAGLLTVALTTLGSLILLHEDQTLNMTFIAMCIPILIASFLIVSWSGFVIAALLIIGSVTTGIAPDDYPALLTLVVVALIAYMFSGSLNQAYQKSRYEALHDALTGLPNRALFVDRLQRSIDRKSRDRDVSAVLFMDLDHFKVVNDSLGHETGDELLIEVARRLSGCLRPEDTAARFGGDEFTILLDRISEPSDAIRVVERIAEALRTPFQLGEHQIFITTSVGIALCTSEDAQPNSVLRDADVAMYEAKKEGKARYKIFNEAMYAKALRRLELENELRRAINNNELRVYYQPKISLETGEIVGMEALVRWEHPERGLTDPEEFIPLAEETALINPLGHWVLQEACRQAREWQDRYPHAAYGRSLTMSVNLSGKQFQQPNLVEDLERILQETGLNPQSLQLEITESVVTDDVDYAIDLLRDLKSLNVQLGIDDFGKGYSSLTSLKEFPLDDLKIDRSFVDGLGKDLQDTAIVELVVELAHAVGMQAVAEGVETSQQLTQLRKIGCDVAQGFYFRRPLTCDAASALLAHYPQRLNLDHL
jgi:diguanylate cyclase (GGDEF)-like protein